MAIDDHSQQLPPAIYSLLVVYLSSFAISYRTKVADKAVPNDIAVGALQEPVDAQPPAVRSTASHSQDVPRAQKLKVERKTVGIQENTMLWERRRYLPLALLTGLPSPSSTWSSLLTLAINVLLATNVADVVYRGHYWHASHDLSFARAGFVSDKSAKILVRESDSTALPIFLSYRNVDDTPDDAWKSVGAIYQLSNASDFTSSMIIDGLKPETRYQYATSTNHSGSFLTAPSAGQRPGRNGGTYTFLTSSCLKPRFPYNPIAHPLNIPGLRKLAMWIPELHPQFMLFLGDFIYVDVPKRFGTDVETYRREYRMTYNSPDWYPVSRYLPWIHVLDDHEIANDWDQNTTGVYPAATEAWENYHNSVNPPAVRPATTYYSFIQGPASFFLLDTRRYRSSEHAAPSDSPEKTMLGPEQLADLLSWLHEAPPAGVRWKIIASSVPLTKNWRFNDKDTWGGYLVERQKILEAMWDVGLLQAGVGVVVLSGDRHEFAATSFPPPPGGKWPTSSTVHEFSTSPLSQFYLPTRTYKQLDDEDVLIKYVPDGNSKFGAVDITTSSADHHQSLFKFRLFVDGVEVWSHVLVTNTTN